MTFWFWAPRGVQLRRRKYEEALLFFCTQRIYNEKCVLGSAADPCKVPSLSILFFLTCTLTVSNLQPAIRLALRRLPTACRLLAAVFIECHICAVKWWSWRIVPARGSASIHDFVSFVLTLAAMLWHKLLFCARGCFIALRHHDCLCHYFLFSSCHLSIRGANVLPQDLNSF